MDDGGLEKDMHQLNIGNKYQKQHFRDAHRKNETGWEQELEREKNKWGKSGKREGDKD